MTELVSRGKIPGIPYFVRLYSWSHSFGYYLQLLIIGEQRNVYLLVNSELCLLAPLPQCANVEQVSTRATSVRSWFIMSEVRVWLMDGHSVCWGGPVWWTQDQVKLLTSQGHNLPISLLWFVAKCEVFGIKISTSKSETMFMVSQKRVEGPLQVRDNILPLEYEFKYFRDLFTSKVSMEQVIEGQIRLFQLF